jgi:hypothetical protein
MTHADHLRIHRLPDQLDAATRRLAQLDRTPREERRAYWYRRRATVIAKHNRLVDRAATLGLRDLAAIGHRS